MIVITEPPNPPIVPRTTAKCQTCNSAKAEIINKRGSVGNINIKSDCLIKYASTLPPKNAAIVPNIVDIPTPKVALKRPSTNAT